MLVLAVSSSEPALPTLMEKMEKLGCSKALVGLVVPTGYTFNTDGSSMYMTHGGAVRGAGHEHPSDAGAAAHDFRGGGAHVQGRSGVQGAAFIALVGTLDGDPDDSGGWNGFDSGNRPFHEHVSRDGEYVGQRRGYAGGGAMGTRA